MIKFLAFDDTTCDGLRTGMTKYNDTIYKFINDAVAETTGKFLDIFENSNIF